MTSDGGDRCARGADCEAGVCLVKWEDAAYEQDVSEGRCATRSDVGYLGNFCSMVDESEALPYIVDDDILHPVRSSTATWVQCLSID